MLYLGKLTEKTTRTAQAEGTGITYLVSCLGISSKIFQVNPADCWDQCYTDSKVLRVDWDGILAATQGKVRCLPCCSGPCPTLRSMMISCAQQHWGAFLGSGEVVPCLFADEMQIFKWAKTFPPGPGGWAGPALSGAAQAAGGLTWLESHSRDCCVTCSFLHALC